MSFLELASEKRIVVVGRSLTQEMNHGLQAAVRMRASLLKHFGGNIYFFELYKPSENP